MNGNLHSQAIGILRLDQTESNGSQGRAIHTGKDRLMALSIQPEPLWYGFVISEAEDLTIAPGEERLIEVAFLDDQGAKKSFPLHASILFGNGITSRGTLILKQYADV